MSNLLLSFTIFAFVASITPGPTNILALNSGMYAGIRPTLPFVIGASASASIILFLTFLGIAEVIVLYPLIRHVMAVIGVLWLTHLAWKLYRSSTVETDKLHNVPDGRHGALLQVINPKVWMMALTASSLFAPNTLPPLTHALVISVIFFSVTCPSMTTWVAAGAMANHTIKSPRHQQAIFKALAVLLMTCSWWALLSEVF